MPSAPRNGGGTPADLRAAIEAFLSRAAQPALLEPGEELLPISAANFHVEERAGRLTLQAWDRTRNFTRRVTAIHASAAARLELVVERFAKRSGPLYLLDLARPAGAELGRRGPRLVFRERFRLFLRRQFPEWNLAELTAEPDLEFSLSPSFPRAFLRHGTQAWAAIACPPEGDSSALLSFGLIWLAYLRRRERRCSIEGLALYLPDRHTRATSLRLLCLDPEAARYELFSYSPEDYVVRIDPRDQGNVDSRLEPCRPAAPALDAPWDRLLSLPGVEHVPLHNGRASLRVRGIEFAEVSAGGLAFGLRDRRPALPAQLPEIVRLAEELDRARSPRADRGAALFRQYPESWLESQARANLEMIDPSLALFPVYGQVPAFAAAERGIMDLLAVDRRGRLAVIELKAVADIHLPLQALDYWIRVRWHLDRGEFHAAGYFPGIELRPEPPRLLLVSPSLEFHPTSETLLSFFARQITVERVGLSMDWRDTVKIVFRLCGAETA